MLLPAPPAHLQELRASGDRGRAKGRLGVRHMSGGDMTVRAGSDLRPLGAGLIRAGQGAPGGQLLR